MRAVVEVEEDRKGRSCLVVTELPYQVNPDNLASKIAELVKDGRVGGIADVRDETSDRTGQRLVIVLKRDAVAKVVLNNLYKHTQLQDTFGANMLALVDGVPRTLRLDQMIRHWVAHQIEVIVRRTRYLLRKAEERAHILRALLKAIDRIDEVIALIRASDSAAAAQQGLMDLLEIDEVQARAILDMQLRRLAALERQQLTDEYEELMAQIADYEGILASPERQREIVGEELGEIVEKYGDDRRTQIIAYEGDVSDERPDRRGGRGRHDHPRRLRQADQDRPVPGPAPRRQGRARRAAAHRRHRRALLRDHDPQLDTVLHQQGPGVPGKGLRAARSGAGRPRPARGQPAGVPAGREIAEVLALTRLPGRAVPGAGDRIGLVKKSRLTDFDSPRSGGIIAINLREDDEVIAARLVSADDDLLLVSKDAKAIRFRASDESLRPDGPGHLRRDRDAVRRGRRTARHARGQGRAPTCSSPLAAGTPSGHRPISTRCRAGAARAS